MSTLENQFLKVSGIEKYLTQQRLLDVLAVLILIYSVTKWNIIWLDEIDIASTFAISTFQL